ncbi:MAG TPA: TolC family protein [Opitutaceae bacterium]|nr:TolC family protein [Opitutaceae bacterium]
MSNRLRSSLVAASLLAGLCLPVSAQTAVPPTSLPAVPAPAAAPLTLQECVQRALQHGFDLEIQRYNPAIAKDAVDVARGGFYPTLSFNGSQSHSDTGPLGGTAGTQSDARDTRLAATDLLQTGTTVNVSTDLNRSKTNPPLLTSFYNPVYNSDLTVAITQPLLRGAGIAVTTATLNRAKIGLTRAGFDFQAQALNIVQQTEAAYYNLVYAREQLRVYRVSLDLANRLLDEAQAKKTVGTATAVDVLQAQVGVANARSNVLSAEKSVKDTSDALLALIDRFELDTTLGDAKFEDFTGQLPVIESSYQLALHHQPDYISAKMQLDQFQLDLGVAKNALKPTVNVDGILGFNGTRGSAYDAFNSAVNRDGNSWEVDLTVSYPWGRVSDKARYRQSLSILSQQTLVVRQLEQNILVQVRSAVRAVETNSEKVKIAALAAEFSAKEYDLENARFSAGLATSRDVLQTQSDLENARVAELQARITLQNSISALHRLEGSSLDRYHLTVPE